MARGENVGIPPRRGPVRRVQRNFVRQSVGLWTLRGKLFLVGAGRHPPKTLSRHGARTSAPRRGADPSAAEVRRRSFSRATIGRWTEHGSSKKGERSPPSLFPFQKQTVFGGCGPGEARPAPTKNSSLARGENVGAPPRRGPVRGRGTTTFCHSIAWVGRKEKGRKP